MTTYNDYLSEYISNLYANEDEALQRTWEDTQKKGLPTINVKPEEGRFLQFIVRACGAKRAVEMGTLGGYSGIWIARGLVPGGMLITLEKESYRAEIAREHFALAGLSEKVEVRVGNAHELLGQLTDEGPFDFVFIDAEKTGYLSYLDWALDNTGKGAIIAAHNAFRGGSVLVESSDDESTESIQAFNKRVAEDPRLISTIYPAGDGMVVAVKA
ncbi:MAG TPA: O-methyltransferase [Anaerolineales bacterium]|nr:O-methyltransferase [Anaerolineales bacterium]